MRFQVRKRWLLIPLLFLLGAALRLNHPPTSDLSHEDPLLAQIEAGRGGPWLPWLDLAPQIQTEIDDPLLSDGQFVWGPNVGDFDVRGFLEERNSPLAPFADDLVASAAYPSLNPRVLLAVVELKYGYLTRISPEISPEQVSADLKLTAMELGVAFYDHLYTWGSRRRAQPDRIFGQPRAPLAVSPGVRLDEALSSGTYALAAALAPGHSAEEVEGLLSTSAPDGFTATFRSLFPDVDPLDESNSINPQALPADTQFQLPFPLGATWTFNGAHSWSGGAYGTDRSSMDFFTSWPADPNQPWPYTAAAAGGAATIRTPYAGRPPCWVEIDHGGGWTTSYYHLRNLGNPGAAGTFSRNQRVGAIGVETCNGGFATGEHVHFTLLYNGAFFDLQGVKLSGWTVNIGPLSADPYTSGYLARDGVIRYPYQSVSNDFQSYYGNGLDYALRFQGNSGADLDRVKLPIDSPNDSNPGPPVDLGYYDFTIEFWMRALPGVNNQGPLNCGANQGWKDGHVLLDASRSFDATGYGVALAEGRLAFGAGRQGGGALTICSASTVADGAWHHITLMRNRHAGKYGDGQLWLAVDGQVEATGIGPIGDLSYPDGAAPGNTCGNGSQSCAGSDPYLFIGGGKASAARPFNGWIDDMRLSWWLRQDTIDTGIPRPTAPHVIDEYTVALLRFDEGAGETVYDISGFYNGASNGLRFYGGNPAGPEWVLSDVYIPLDLEPVHYLPLILH